MDTFHRESGNYRYRVVALALYEGHLFLQQQGNIWHPPATIIKPEQPARVALHDFLSQTMQIESTIGRLLWAIEHRYDWHDKIIFECTFSFLVTMPVALCSFPLNTPITWWQESGAALVFQWVPLEQLKQQKSKATGNHLCSPGVCDAIQRIAYRRIEWYSVA